MFTDGSVDCIADAEQQIEVRDNANNVIESSNQLNRAECCPNTCEVSSCHDESNLTNQQKKSALTPVASAKRQQLKPNYFIAIPIMSQQIRDKIGDIQQHILLQNERLQSSLIPLPTLHLTIMVMKLADDSEIKQAKVVLDNLRVSLVEQSSGPVEFSLSGLGHFYNSVLFAKICDDVNLIKLKEIAGTVLQMFSSNGLPSTDSRGFQPHVTVMKLSKDPKLFKQGIKKIDPHVYSDHAADFMGLETATRLQLCSMHLPKDPVTGYYHIAHEVELI